MHPRRAPLLLLLLGVLVAVQVVLTLLLVVGAAVPEGPVARSLAQGIEEERVWGFPENDGLGGFGTPSTDQAVLTSGLGRPEAGAWERAMLMPRLATGTPSYEQVMTLAQDRQVEDDLRGYFRYWAGYTVLTRPVLAVWGVPGVRLAAGVLLVAGAWLAAREIARRTSPVHVVALAAPLLLGTNIVVTPSVSMAHALSFAAAFAGLALLVWAEGRGLRALLVATIFGAALYNFVDLLTNPVVPWAFSAALAGVLAYRRTGDLRDLVVRGGAVGLVWPVAWAVTWMSRWLLAVLALGWDEAWADITGQVQARMDLDVASVDGTLGASTWRNAAYWWDHLPTAPLLLVLTLVVVAGVAVRLARHGARELVPLLLLASPVLLVPVWYEVFSNHSQIHASFTARAVAAALSVLLLAAVTAWEQRPRAGTGRPATEERADSGSAAASSRSSRRTPR